MTDNTEALPPLPQRWTTGDASTSEAGGFVAYSDYLELRRAALAQRQQLPERRPDGMPASADERYLRRLLAVRSGIFGAYFDDGEAQGQEHGIVIDFMREPVADVDAKLRALNVARADLTAAPSAQAEPKVPLPPILFDGYAVYQALDKKAQSRTSTENVSDVLDAVVRLLRGIGKQEGK